MMSDKRVDAVEESIADPAADLIGQIKIDANLPRILVDRLRSMIMDGELPPGTKLPSEPEFAKALNISRSTLRVALDRLMLEGVILRKRGVGTFVSDEPLVENNLNVNTGVTDLIRSIGAEPGTLDLRVSMETASYRVAQNLNMELDTPVICVERIRTADHRRVVYMNDILPQSLITSHRPELSIREIKEYLQENHSVYKLIKNELGIAIHHGTAKLRPVIADKVIAEKLEVDEGSGLLYFEQIDYGQNGLPIVFSDEYHVAGAFTFTIYRS